MAQFLDEGVEGQETQCEFNLKAHLSKYNVPDRVYGLLNDESITIDELITFTILDLKDWCNEHSLKTIEKKRFINSIKSLPNSQSSKPDAEEKTKIVQVPVFLGNEEKEQLAQFGDMKNNVKNMIRNVNETTTKLKNVDAVINEINHVCDKIESFVETLRRNFLQQVFHALFCILFTLVIT